MKAEERSEAERAHFWSEVAAAESGVGGCRDFGRCLPDTEEELFGVGERCKLDPGLN